MEQTPLPSVPTPHPTKHTIPWVIGGVVVAAAALGYSLGTLKDSPPTPPTNTTSAAETPTQNQSEAGTEVPFLADAIVVGGKMVLTGTISHLTPQGFELEITKPVVNTATRSVSQRTFYYNVKLTSTTKLTQYTFTSTIPPQGGEPEIKQTVTTLGSSNLKEGAVATVTGGEKSSGTNLVALDVRVTSLIKR